MASSSAKAFPISAGVAGSERGTGSVPNIAQTEQTIMGLKLLMFVLSSIIFATMMFIYVKCYKLNGDFYKDMLSMLEITREQKKLEQAQA